MADPTISKTSPCAQLDRVHELQDLPTFDTSWALFLDFDGTLVDIAPTPQDVSLNPQLKQALCSQSVALSGALAIVSGRTIAELDEYLTPLQLPCAGMHGAEIRLGNGGCIATLKNSDPEMSTAFLVARQRLSHAKLAHVGVIIEDKPLGISIHYRAAPATKDACFEAARSAVDGLERLSVRPGKMVVEIVPTGTDKGQAVEQLLRVAPFLGRKPVCVGDDEADEAAFAAAQRLGGFGIRILDQSCALSGATYRLQGPDAFRKWFMNG
jgi:trehalose 6-phosphate phosphatase